jgi:hypothetical protein
LRSSDSASSSDFSAISVVRRAPATAPFVLRNTPDACHRSLVTNYRRQTSANLGNLLLLRKRSFAPKNIRLRGKVDDEALSCFGRVAVTSKTVREETPQSGSSARHVNLDVIPSIRSRGKKVEREITIAERDDVLPFSRRVRQLFEEHPLYALAVLFLLAILCYIGSTWSALHLSHAARLMADTARQVAAKRGDDEALQRELLVRLSDLQRRGDASEAMLHLSIAFVVAIVIVFTVELYSAARTRREITEYREAVAREVWTALSGRLVPPQIVDEIHGILKADAIKDDVQYVLTFLRYEGLPPDLIVLRRNVSYTIRNVTRRKVAHPVRSLIHSVYPDMVCRDKSGAHVTVPRHIEFKIDGQSIQLNEASKTLHKNRHGHLRDLRYDVDLGRTKSSVRVFISTEEQVPLSGSNAYIQTVPVTNLTVSVENKIDDVIRVIEVQLAHPNYEEFSKDENGTYRYAGGILPGRSLAVLWEPLSPTGGNKSSGGGVARLHSG